MICRNSVLIFANQLTRLLRAFTGASMEKTMKRTFAIGTLVAALTLAGSAQLSAQNSAPGDWQKVLIPYGETVYDVVNNVVWLADFNLAASDDADSAGDQTADDAPPRFGLPVCPPLTMEPTEPCVNPSGSMNYTSAVKWVQRMNDANYLGHSDWQLPTAPLKEDSHCSSNGPWPYREGFAFGCDEGALGYLYYTALGFTAPNTAVPIPPNTVGPFSNFQPNLYWSDSGGGGHACKDPGPKANFSFASGDHGGGCGGDYADVLPMLAGDPFVVEQIPGSLPLYVNPPDGQTIYDPETDTTWLADANLAATWLPDSGIGVFDTLGLPLCTTGPEATPCAALDGSMNYASAQQFIINMNAYDGGKGYLGQKNWRLPSLDADVKYCPTYGCAGTLNPLGNLYYNQLVYDGKLGFPAGTPVVPVPDIAVGPFNNLVPFPYWSCLADTIHEPCQSADSESKDNEPSKNSEWGFSFGTGFLGTERLTANHYVTVYYVLAVPPTKPPIPPKCPPTDPSCYQ
jgi:hypothetical protein